MPPESQVTTVCGDDVSISECVNLSQIERLQYNRGAISGQVEKSQEDEAHPGAGCGSSVIEDTPPVPSIHPEIQPYNHPAWKPRSPHLFLLTSFFHLLLALLWDISSVLPTALVILDGFLIRKAA